MVMVTLPGVDPGNDLQTSFERELSVPFLSVTEIWKYTVVLGTRPRVTTTGAPVTPLLTFVSVPVAAAW
jgi:hypothetical protein